VINVTKLEASFESGDEVTPETLRAKGLVSAKGPVKVLGNGEITTPLTVDVDAISAAAAEKITAAGGTVN
jgi:large subunit ribosomal protein L15